MAKPVGRRKIDIIALMESLFTPCDSHELYFAESMGIMARLKIIRRGIDVCSIIC